jgi:hypothetical protein
MMILRGGIANTGVHVEPMTTISALEAVLETMTYSEQVLFLHSLTEAAFRILNQMIQKDINRASDRDA